MRTGARRKNKVLGLEAPSGDLDGMRVDDLALGVKYVFEIELLLALVVHDRVRTGTPLPEQVDDVLDRGDDAVHLRKPERPAEGALKHQFSGAIGKQMMGYAGVVRTGAAEERPRLDDQLASAHRAQVRGAKTAAGSATEIDRVVLARIAFIDIEQRGTVRRVVDLF